MSETIKHRIITAIKQAGGTIERTNILDMCGRPPEHYGILQGIEHDLTEQGIPDPTGPRNKLTFTPWAMNLWLKSKPPTN